MGSSLLYLTTHLTSLGSPVKISNLLWKKQKLFFPPLPIPAWVFHNTVPSFTKLFKAKPSIILDNFFFCLLPISNPSTGHTDCTFKSQVSLLLTVIPPWASSKLLAFPHRCTNSLLVSLPVLWHLNISPPQKLEWIFIKSTILWHFPYWHSSSGFPLH